MRGVRFTKAETEYLERMVDAAGDPSDARLFFGTMPSPKEFKLQQSILTKLKAAGEPQQPGVNAVAFERALVESARGKVVAVEGGNATYARVSRQATSVGASVQAAAVIGSWIASQSWLTGPLTVFTVLNKWPDWLARAKAVAAPGGLPEGDLGPGTTQARPKATAGRRAPGIG